MVGSHWEIVEGKRKIVAKQLHRFSLTPMFHRLSMTNEMALNMQWYESSRIYDRFLRHPTDFEACKTFDATYVDSPCILKM